MISDESWIEVQVERALEAGLEAALVAAWNQGLFEVAASTQLLVERAQAIGEIRTREGKPPVSRTMRSVLEQLMERLEQVVVLAEEVQR